MKSILVSAACLIALATAAISRATSPPGKRSGSSKPASAAAPPASIARASSPAAGTCRATTPHAPSPSSRTPSHPMASCCPATSCSATATSCYSTGGSSPTSDSSSSKPAHIRHGRSERSKSASPTSVHQASTPAATTTSADSARLPLRSMMSSLCHRPAGHKPVSRLTGLTGGRTLWPCAYRRSATDHLPWSGGFCGVGRSVESAVLPALCNIGKSQPAPHATKNSSSRTYFTIDARREAAHNRRDPSRSCFIRIFRRSGEWPLKGPCSRPGFRSARLPPDRC